VHGARLTAGCAEQQQSHAPLGQRNDEGEEGRRLEHHRHAACGEHGGGNSRLGGGARALGDGADAPHQICHDARPRQQPQRCQHTSQKHVLRAAARTTGLSHCVQQ
jgi:hypothetical protein